MPLKWKPRKTSCSVPCVGLALRCLDEQVMPFSSEQIALPARRDRAKAIGLVLQLGALRLI